MQVAGHLFEEGKAGSLVDDRGHFYKPIQPGPRGDRECAFYKAIAAAIGADRVSQAIRAHQRDLASTAAATGSAAAALAVTGPTPAMQVPWIGHRLPSHPFPSFKNSYREVRQRDPMRVLQKDELGLITEAEVGEWLDQLGAVHITERAADRSDDEDDDDFEEDPNWYGRSPDSDEGGVLTTTGDHVMEGITSAHLEAQERLGQVGAGSPCSPLLLKESGREIQQQQQQQREGDAGTSVSDTSPRHGPRQRDDVVGPSDPADHEQAAALLGQTVYGWEGGEGEGPYLQTSPVHSTHTVLVNGGLAEALRRASLDGEPPGQGATAAVLQTPSCSKSEQQGRHGDVQNAQTVTMSRAAAEAVAAVDAETAASGAAVAGLPRRRSVDGMRVTAERMPVLPAAALDQFNKLPFTLRNAPLLRVLPRFYGVRQGDGRTLLELEDLARSYSHPCIMDIKIGHRTWYPQADPAYIERCRAKDAATTQAALGFKICGMQVYRHGQGGYWRASKRWCKTLPEVLVDKALLSFVHNEHGLKPSDVYGGAGGAVAQLEDLAAWFRLQREFRFYSASVLILYEGDASEAGGAAVRVRLVDFAHTFQTDERGKGDDNFLAGLLSLTARLNGVSRIETADTLM